MNRSRPNAATESRAPNEPSAVESILRRFESAWIRGERPEIAGYLPVEPALRNFVFAELTFAELEFRLKAGESVRVEELLARRDDCQIKGERLIELLEHERSLRRRLGGVDDKEYLLRFPQLCDRLRTRWQPKDVSRGSTRKLAASGNTPGGSGDAPLDLPRNFGRYRLLRQLGRGGMGTVYLADDPHLERQVAIKIPRLSLNSANEADAETVARFLREARSAARLQHPNLCTVHDAGKIDGVHFLTMGFVAGPSLQERLPKLALGEPAIVAELVETIARGMQAAHALGVVHRDLKPANVILRGDRDPVVVDWGLAARVDGTDPRLTEQGVRLGSPAYMAPELAAGDAIAAGPAADIYSLGVVLYELLTGRCPFEGTSSQVVAQHLAAAPLQPSHRRTTLDARWDVICSKALAKRPEDRYPTMLAFADDLRNARNRTISIAPDWRTPRGCASAPPPRWQVAQAAPRGGRPQRSLAPLWIAVSGAAAMVAAALGIQFALSDPNSANGGNGATGLAGKSASDSGSKSGPGERDRDTTIVFGGGGGGGTGGVWGGGFGSGFGGGMVTFDPQGATNSTEAKQRPSQTSEPQTQATVSPSQKQNSPSEEEEPPDRQWVSKLPDYLQDKPAIEPLRVLTEKQPPAASGEAVNVSMASAVCAVHKRRKEFTFIDDGDEISSRDEYFVAVQVKSAGYLYIFQCDSHGKMNWLFPKNEAQLESSGVNPVQPDQIVQFPPTGKDKPALLDDQIGVEHVYAVFSATPWPELEDALTAAEYANKTAVSQEDQAVNDPVFSRTRGFGGIAKDDAASTRRRMSRKRETEHVSFLPEEFDRSSGSFLVKTHWFRHVK